MSPSDADHGARVVRFPVSRTRPPGPRAADLGPSRLARAIGLPARQLTGHWCSRCQGIWYGYPLEVECPVCGSRDG